MALKACFALAAAAACLIEGAAAPSRTPTPAPAAANPPAAGSTVKIDNFTFSPASVTVKPGTTVTWVNGDDIPHTVRAVDGSFKSKVLDSDDRFAFTFSKAGEYAYFCSLHPHMTGKVIVRG
jgi:plastocyanin